MIKQPCDTGVILGGPASAVCKPRERGWILAATILGSSMAFIDGTAVNVALPALQTVFHAEVTDVQWIIESYALLLSSLLLTGGAAGDLFGRRRTYIAGTALFSAASVFCGLSTDIRMLILSRAVQGVGAALLVPGSLALITASFEEEYRGRAIGTWSGFTAITAAIGPVLGGWLVQHASWRWIFFINFPVSIAVLALVIRYVPESRGHDKGRRLDWPGAALASGGLGGIVFGFIESSNRGWQDLAVIGALVLGVGSLALFLLRESRVNNPMLSLDLFRSRNFSGANLLTLFQYAALSGALFFLPFDLIQVQGYTPTQAGAALLPFILIMFFLSRWSGGLVRRIGAKLPLVAGPIITAAAFALLMVPAVGQPYWTSFFPGILVLGLGMALVVAPLTTTVMNAVPQDRAGIASGVNNAVSRVAGLLAVAIFGILLVNVFAYRLDRSLSNLDVRPDLRQTIERQSTKLAAIEVPPGTPAIQAELIRETINKSYVTGFRSVMLLSALLSLLSALCAWLVIN
jgi:EmrB/QacA subfamily drug resistance transporter